MYMYRSSATSTYQLAMETFEVLVERCVRGYDVTFRPRAATGLRCGGDALVRNR